MLSYVLFSSNIKIVTSHLFFLVDETWNYFNNIWCVWYNPTPVRGNPKIFLAFTANRKVSMEAQPPEFLCGLRRTEVFLQKVCESKKRIC